MTATTAPRALEQAFEQHHAMVYRAAYRVTGRAADAEDALQTVFLRLVRSGVSFGEISSPESYLRRAAVNAALDIVRSGKQRSLTEIGDLPGDPGPSAEAPELRNMLRRALATLAARDAEVFALRHFEDKTNRDIAAMLGISQVHVAVILHRAKKQLQREMSSYVGGKR